MMGRLKRDQGQFFYSFCLDEVVPADQLVQEKLQGDRLDQRFEQKLASVEMIGLEGCRELTPFRSRRRRPPFNPIAPTPPP